MKSSKFKFVLKYNLTFKTLLRSLFKDEQDFATRVLKSKTPVVVDFFATWCNPCKLLTPRIEGIINENKGKVSLAKVNEFFICSFIHIPKYHFVEG